jgi:hypothetical protein
VITANEFAGTSDRTGAQAREARQSTADNRLLTIISKQPFGAGAQDAPRKIELFISDDSFLHKAHL